jgi:cytosine/adenosine deaminase-related metal-dependent hydrolase
MPTVLVPAQLTVEHLMAAIKQLSPDELREFAQQFAAWQAKNGVQADEEAALLAAIEENSRLPAAAQRRYERLRRKCERRALTEHELVEYQRLLQQLEARNVKRVESLIAIAQRRGTTLQGIMAELGLPSADNAE